MAFAIRARASALIFLRPLGPFATTFFDELDELFFCAHLARNAAAIFARAAALIFLRVLGAGALRTGDRMLARREASLPL